ncbi:MAG: Uroporphyrinogen synthase [Cyanobacteria bacterium RYN_339]|nr:Uroporphyrinogen synthase [Cyanobacteria bacterium RYN_339]
MASPGINYRRILITRAPDQADGMARALQALGAETEELATIRIVPGDPADLAAALANLPPNAWLVFTSANAVRAVAAWPTTRLAAVGPATAAALAAAVRPPDLVAAQQDGLGLARALAAAGGGLAVLPRGDLATPELPAALVAAGWRVREVVAYRTLPAELDGAALGARLGGGDFDWVVFASGSAFTSLAAQLPDARVLGGVRLASIGPRTSQVIRAAGFAVAAEALQPTPAGLAAAIGGT